MSNLRDQLKKAKLLSKKDAKRLAHEERLKRKEVGREGLEKEQEDRQRQLAEAQASTRESDREREAESEEQRQRRAELVACEALLQEQVRRAGGRGGRPWYFEVEGGWLPSLGLEEADRHQLEGGHVCLVRTGAAGSHAYGLLAAQHARRVEAALPGRVVWAAPGLLAG